jgi:hypothetical protein
MKMLGEINCSVCFEILHYKVTRKKENGEE